MDATPCDTDAPGMPPPTVPPMMTSAIAEAARQVAEAGKAYIDTRPATRLPTSFTTAPEILRHDADAWNYEARCINAKPPTRRAALEAALKSKQGPLVHALRVSGGELDLWVAEEAVKNAAGLEVWAGLVWDCLLTTLIGDKDVFEDPVIKPQLTAWCVAHTKAWRGPYVAPTHAS